MPIKESDDEFGWGVWVRIQETDFRRYLELWDADTAASEPPFMGHLSGGIRDYPGSDSLEVKVQLQANSQRPRFYVVSKDHPLGLDQQNGITMELVHQFVEPHMPYLKKQDSE